MKALSKLIGIGLLLTPLFSGVYVVPAEFDNFRLGHLSSSYGILNSTSPGVSTNSYTLGGQTVRYRCLIVPKVDCVASTASIVPALSEVSVRHAGTGEVLSLWTADIRIEEDLTTTVAAPAGSWYICGGAYAGERSDDSTMSLVNNADGSQSINYIYEPNINHYDAIAFSTTTPAGFNAPHVSSYMTIRYKQICR